MSSTSSVMAIAKTPSLKASVRLVSQWSFTRAGFDAGPRAPCAQPRAGSIGESGQRSVEGDLGDARERARDGAACLGGRSGACEAVGVDAAGLSAYRQR